MAPAGHEPKGCHQAPFLIFGLDHVFGIAFACIVDSPRPGDIPCVNDM